MEPHRAGRRRDLPRRTGALPAPVPRPARAGRRPGGHLPSLHDTDLADRTGRLGVRSRRRALRPLLHGRRRGAGRRHDARLHHQRAQHRGHDGLACRDVPAGQDRRRAVPHGGRTPGRCPPRRRRRHPRRRTGGARRIDPLHDRLPARSGRRREAREHPAPRRGRLPRRHQGGRLPRRAGVHAHADRARRLGRLRGGGARPRHGLRVLPGLARQLPHARVGVHGRLDSPAGHRERHRHDRRRAAHRLRAPGPVGRARRDRRRRRACGATPTGRCSTISSGRSATGRASASSASTARRSPARPSPAPAGSPRWRRPTPSTADGSDRRPGRCWRRWRR